MQTPHVEPNKDVLYSDLLDVYLNRRWTKNVLPAHLLDKRHRYGPCIEETDMLASQVHQTIEECIGLFRNDTDKLSEL
ncbi:hypothetical protein Tco_0614109, partial [Tanacetum coccineum]